MNDKEKQIKEMAKTMTGCNKTCDECYSEYEKLFGKQKDAQCICITEATTLYNAGYRKLPEDSVVLTREEYNEFLRQGAMIDFLKDCIQQARKETAREILNKIYHLSKGYYIDDEEEYIEMIKKLAKQYGDRKSVV